MGTLFDMVGVNVANPEEEDVGVCDTAMVSVNVVVDVEVTVGLSGVALGVLVGDGVCVLVGV